MSIGVFNVLYIIRIENLLPLFGRKKDKDRLGGRGCGLAHVSSCDHPRAQSRLRRPRGKTCVDPGIVGGSPDVEVEAAGGRDVRGP